MWNYNLDEMPKDGTEIIVICQIPDGEHFVRMISYQNEKWMTVETPKIGFLINAIKCWALAPKKSENDGVEKLIDWFDHWFDYVYPSIANDYSVPYWKGLNAIRDRIKFKLGENDKSHQKEPEADNKFCSSCARLSQGKGNALCLTCGRNYLG